MDEQERENQFVEKIRGFLDESTESLNPKIRLRLQESRTQALKAVEKRHAWFLSFPQWITVGGLATATTAILIFFFWLNVPSLEAPTKQVEDFEIITSKEQIDFYQDLEFFRWLAAKENET
ncbi:MAG: hypothetical protein H6Q43_613 [Deltaproteobacteria bacterium]|jgi:hypothetical protein|nr:hypothetical protein [Deltaproteobacteria bacterium]